MCVALTPSVSKTALVFQDIFTFGMSTVSISQGFIHAAAATAASGPLPRIAVEH